MQAILLILALTVAQDDERTREEEMFGAAPETVTTTTATAATSTRAASELESQIFGERSPSSPGGLDVESVLAEANDKLDIGGLLYLRLEYRARDREDLEKSALISPNLLDVYLDVRPTDRLRGYVQGRLEWDPTLEGDAAGNEVESAFASTDLLGRGGRGSLGVLLDQLWLKLDVERTVFVTLGRQRLKWGSGRFWNPTDFLNRERKNPLDVFDQRTGVGLVKVHVPLERLGWNFYALATVDEAQAPEDVGGALRAEILVGETEVALSGAVRKDRPIRVGVDVSSGISIFDVHAELGLQHRVTSPFFRGRFALDRVESLLACGAASRGDPLEGSLAMAAPERYSRRDDWIPQLAAGFDVQVKYSDEDTIVLGGEYFFNDAGYADESLYPWLLCEGAFVPFYVGRHYASAFAFLASPGSWNDTSFILSAIANLSDRTGVLRLDYQVRVLTYLDVNVFGMVHAGENGELRFGLSVPPIEGVPELANGVVLSPPAFEIGAGVRIDL